jgi:O-antigen ligase
MTASVMQNFWTAIDPWATRLRNYAFIALGFVLPLSAAAISVLFVLIFLLWIVDRNYCFKVQELCKNPVYVALFAFFVLHLAGQYWTTEPVNGFKSWMLFLVPVLATSVDSKSARRGVYAFVIGMMVAEAGVYYKIFEVWERYVQGFYSNDLYIAMGHISYNPVLAIAIGLLLTTLLAGKYQGWRMAISLLFLLTMIANMFMTGGRAGHVGFIFMWLVLSVYFLWRKPAALIGMIGSLILILALAWNFSPVFKSRVNAATSDLVDYQKDVEDMTVTENTETSVGLRLHFSEQSIRIFLEKPWLGHGTGSFQAAYADYQSRADHKVFPTENPHNNHALILVQFGVLGLVFYGAIFLTQLWAVRRMPLDYEFRPLALLLPLFFVLICFYDSYLWGHHTQAVFAYLTSIFYRSDLYLQKQNA